jgi:SPP1 family predicted phage head-tail adaptor
MNSIGAMRHRITIEKKITGETENGFSIEAFESVATVWAEVKPVQSREYEKADTTQNEVRVRFRIRYLPVLEPSMEVIFSGERYEIIFIENLDFKNRYLEIIGKKVNSSG